MFTRDPVPGASVIAQALASVPTSAANTQVIRPTMASTFSARRHRQRGGASRKQQKKQQTRKQKQQTRKQKQRGGYFSPSVMGPFLKNVEALAAPLSIYIGYKMYKSLKGKRNTQRA